MEAHHSPASSSFTILHELRRHYNDYIFKLKRSIDEKNIEILSELSANSFNVTEETKQDIDKIAHFQQKISISQAALDAIKSILNGHPNLETLAKEAPNVIETLLWLIKKEENKFFYNELKVELQKFIGIEATAKLEKFTHIKTEDLEKLFHFELNQEGINDYLACVESVYLPEEGVEAEEPEETFDNIPKDAEAVVDTSKATLYTKHHFKHSNQEKKQKKDLYKNMYNCLCTHQADKNKKLVLDSDKVGKPKTLNKASHFDFSLPSNNLRVGTQTTEEKPANFFQHLDSSLKCTQHHFTDENFPPVPESITTRLKKYPNVPKIHWKRIPEVYHKKVLTLCSDEIGPDDIHQGALGNCFFLSALSALAEQKQYIHRLFGIRQINQAGCYSVWLCDSGEWKNYVVDDYIPIGQIKGVYTPLFSRSKGNDIWVLLLEKAYAKMHTSYYITSTGFQGEALGGLTGAPIKYYDPKKKGADGLESIWKFLVDATQNKFVITTAGRSENKALKHKAVGLVSAHAYALLDAREVQKADGTKVRLIKMRNPWGTREWTGAWGDGSAEWTPEILQSLNYLPKAMDGVFWITVEDFDKYFYQICVCQVHPDYKYSFMRMGEGRRQSVFIAKVRVDKPGFMYLSAQQKRQKFFKGNPAYHYSHTRVLVSKLDDDGQIVSFVDGKCNREQSVVIKREFEKGTYLVLVEVDWNQTFLQEIVLTAYAPMEVDMEEEPLEKYNVDSLYERIAVLYCRNPENKKVKRIQMKFGTKERSIWKTTLTDRFGLTGILFSNQEKELDVNYRIKVKALENYQWVTPKVTEPSTLIMTPAGEEKMVLLKTKRHNVKAKETTFSYGDAFTLTHNFDQEKLKEKAKEKGIKAQLAKGKNLFVYSYNYFGGMCILYQNLEKADTLHDHVEFTSTDLLINGEDKQTIEVLVPPESEFLVDAKQKDIFGNPKFDRTSKPRITK